MFPGRLIKRPAGTACQTRGGHQLTADQPYTLPAVSIEIRLYRKGTYILAGIHGMDHFCTKLAPPPYTVIRQGVVSVKYIHLWGWYGLVMYRFLTK
jgi:hypothetical protein